MDRERQRLPISDRVRHVLATQDPELLRELEWIERSFTANIAHVSANSKFPHWPIDRWISVLGFSGVLLWQIFNAGSNWTGVKRDINEVRDSVARMHLSLEQHQMEMAKQVDEISAQLRAAEAELAAERGDAAVKRPTPIFSRESQFLGRER